MSPPGPGAPLIDVHAHFVTDGYVAAATAAGHVEPDGIPGYPTWDAETHLGLMDGWGVRTSILSISSPGVHFGDDRAACTLAREVNEFGARTAREHRGRFGHFASLSLPDVAGSDRRRAVVFVHPTSSDLVFGGVLTRYPHIEWIFTRGGGTPLAEITAQVSSLDEAPQPAGDTWRS